MILIFLLFMPFFSVFYNKFKNSVLLVETLCIYSKGEPDSRLPLHINRIKSIYIYIFFSCIEYIYH